MMEKGGGMEETGNGKTEGMDSELVEIQEPVGEREAEVLGDGTGRKGGELRAKPMTPKMLSLMQKVAEFRYLTMEEIELVYANQSYAYSVINSLKDAGLLAEFKTGVQPRKAFYLKPRGYRLLQTYGQLRLKRRFQPQNFLPFIFDHRRACAKAGIILEKHPLVSGYVPESILWERKRPHQSKVCDAEFLFKAPGTEKPFRVGLEVELTQKSRENLVQSFRNFQDRTDLDQVWWLCGNQTVFRTVATLGAELRWIPQPQLLATWEHFLEARHRLELADPKGTVYTIDPGKPTLSPRPEPPVPKPVPVVMPVVAQAKAPRPPEPAPPEISEPEPTLAWRLLSWLGSLLLSLLRWTWEWVEDSWTFYRVGRWGFGLEFHRWPHVWAVAILCVALAGYRHWETLERRFFPPMPGERRVAAKRKPPKPAPVAHKPGDRCWWSHSPLEPDELVPCDTINDRPRPVDGMVDMSVNGRIDAWLKKMEKEQKQSGSAPRQSEPQ